jgi:putative transposase
MISLPVNKGDAFSLRGVEFFILAISSDGTVLAEEVDRREHRQISSTEFMAHYLAGSITLLICKGARQARPKWIPRSLESYSPKDQDDARRRWRYIRGLLDVGWKSTTVHLPLKDAIARIAAEHSDSTPPSVSSVCRWWRRYASTGCDTMALVALSERKGGRARPRLPESVELIVEEEVAAHYLRRNPPSVRLILDRILLRITEENKWRDQRDKLKPPSLATLYRRISDIPAYERAVAHMGRDAAKRRFRVVNGGLVTTRLMERVEFDHTLLDCIIVDDEHFLPLGRPWLTVAIDAHSRMVCGYQISFSTPSAHTVLQCLVDVVSPKLEKFDGVNCEWPAYGVPEQIVTDNGLEFHSKSLEDAALELGCSVQYCIRRQPEYKGRIERFLGTLNRAIAHHAPGTTRSNPKERGDYDAAKHACVPLSAMKRLVHKWIVDIYSQEYHRGIEARPIDAWNENLKLHAPKAHASIDSLRQYLGLIETRTLNQEGIRLFGDQRYQSDELTALAKQIGPELRLTIKYFPDDIGYIFVQHPFERAYIRVNNTNPSYADGLPLRQHKFIRQRLREAGRRHVDELTLARERVKLADELMWWARDKKRAIRKQANRLQSQEKHGIANGKLEDSCVSTNLGRKWDNRPLQENAFEVVLLQKEDPQCPINNR